MISKELFLDSIEVSYKLLELELQDILIFYKKNKFIKEKENILNKNILKPGDYKEINGYKFIKTLSINIQTVFADNKLYILSDEFYLINRLNYSNAIGILGIFEKHIPRLVYNIISYDEDIIKNSKNDISIKLNPKDIYFMTKELKDINIERMLILNLASEIIDNMIRSKKDFFKKISNLLQIEEIKDDEKFKNFITIRNIISHLNGKTDYGFKSNITDREIDGYTLYLTSKEIIKITDYLIETIKILHEKILKKYKI